MHTKFHSLLSGGVGVAGGSGGWIIKISGVIVSAFVDWHWEQWWDWSVGTMAGSANSGVLQLGIYIYIYWCFGE